MQAIMASTLGINRSEIRSYLGALIEQRQRGTLLRHTEGHADELPQYSPPTISIGPDRADSPPRQRPRNSWGLVSLPSHVQTGSWFVD